VNVQQLEDIRVKMVQVTDTQGSSTPSAEALKKAAMLLEQV
jgi:hypothetical protein